MGLLDHAADRVALGGCDAGGARAACARAPTPWVPRSSRSCARSCCPAALSGVMAVDHPGHVARHGRDDGRRPRGRARTRSSSFDPLESVQTMTAFIVQISLGDTPQGSVQFSVALRGRRDVLFAITLVLNLLEQPDRRAVPERRTDERARRHAGGRPGRPRSTPADAPEAHRDAVLRRLPGRDRDPRCSRCCVLLVDVCHAGLPYLDTDFLDRDPSRIAGRCRHPAGAARLAQIGLIVGGLTLPDRRRRGDLPRGVRRGQLRQPAPADEHRATSPACLRSSTASSAWPCSCVCSASATTLLAGALTLVLLILPVVIIATMEALRAVPDSQREGAYALGRDALADGPRVRCCRPQRRGS